MIDSKTRKVPNDPPKDHIDLGLIMLREAGPAACEAGYGTTDPYWVGRYALGYGDITRDGTLS
jgi:hypothetical protein